MQVRRYKNDNISMKCDCEYDLEYTLESVLNTLLDYDCTISSEEYCVNNFETAIDLYSYFSDKKITVYYNDLSKLKEGKTVTFKAVRMTSYDYESLELQENYNGSYNFDNLIKAFKTFSGSYQEKKARLHDIAIMYSSNAANYLLDWMTCDEVSSFFYKYGRKYGLLKEFQNEGIC